MIKPASYWAMHKTCDAYTLGRVGAVLGGQAVEPPLNPAEQALVSVVKQDSEWMDERVEAQREKWKERQRKSRLSRIVTRDNGDGAVSHEKGECHDTSVRPSVHPSVHPKQYLTNRSVTVTVPAEKSNGNGNGTGCEVVEMLPGGSSESRRLAAKFANAAKSDPGAFFDAEHDAVSICAAVTGDFRSLKRWRQLVKAKGEAAVREETFAFWREISAGEDVANRGATLNARLARLPDEEGEVKV